MSLIDKSDRIFLAGHRGMVGSAIKRLLKKRKYKNILAPGRNELNLLDFDSVEKWFRENRPSIVILAAAKVGGIDANNRFPGDFILENLKIQNNVIENAWKNNIKRFLFLGSSCIYPKFSKQPIKEDYLLDGGLEITNEPYAIAKIAGIKLCSALKKQYGFDAISLMPTNLYGPGDNYHERDSHVMPALIKKIYDSKRLNIPKTIFWGSGNPRREFLHVDDLADAAIFVLENISSDNKLLKDFREEYLGILNVGTGKDISIKELAEKICSEQKYYGEIEWDLKKPDGTPRKLLDVSRIKELGWEAKIGFSQGIKDTIKSFIEESENETIRI